ncbi:hypothetical protein C8R47DRAFT_969989, partial [Mycena vitilis]
PKEWAVKARAFLCNAEFGADWTSLVDAWWVREEAAGFEGTRQPHCAKKRPGAVGAWVGRARNYSYKPQLGDIDEYGRTWWGWWMDINPARRGEKRPLLREAVTDWEGMDLDGQNGFLNVVISLKWWRDALNAASGEWTEAVADVTWVLRQMHGYVFSHQLLATKS